MAGWFLDENPHESWKKLDDLGVPPWIWKLWIGPWQFWQRGQVFGHSDANWQTLIWTVWACSRCPKSSKIEIENRWTAQVAEQELGTSYKQWPAVANWLVVPLQTMLKSNLWRLFSFFVPFMWLQVYTWYNSDIPIYLHFVFSGLFSHTWPWTIQEVWPWQSWHEMLIRQASIWWKQIEHLRASNRRQRLGTKWLRGFAGGGVVTFTRGHEFVI